MSLGGWIALVLGSSICLLAQETDAVRQQLDQVEESATGSGDPLPASAISFAAEPAEAPSQAGAGTPAVYAPLTLKQKWLFSMSAIFGPPLAYYIGHPIISRQKAVCRHPGAVIVPNHESMNHGIFGSFPGAVLAGPEITRVFMVHGLDCKLEVMPDQAVPEVTRQPDRQGVSAPAPLFRQVK